MKTNRKKIVNIVLGILSCCGIILIAGVCLLMVGIFMIDYQRSPHNQKADDAISRAVYEAVGAKELYYQGKSENRAGTTTYYEFYVHEEKKGVVDEAVNAINTVLEQEKSGRKVCIVFTTRFNWNAYETLFNVCNYTDDNSSADYEKLQCLRIYGTDLRTEESIYNDPETYKNLQDIRHLEVKEKIQKAADEAGIDWYEYWPELETVEIYSSEK